VFDKTKILIFGGFHSSSCRYNDVWVFDTITMSWEQPVEDHAEFTEEGNHVVPSGSKAPFPRGAHTASRVGTTVFIFGGYGGSGYARKDFNDLHALDLDTFKWTKSQPKGTSPLPRSGHDAAVVNHQVYVFGGWNSSTQFKDLHILDTETMTWSEAESGWGTPRWNLTVCSVEAIPNWKVFVFGGVSGDLSATKRVQGEFLDTINVLDTGSNTWVEPEVSGAPPCARSDTKLAYDAKGSRLVMFGGWANRWYGDLYTLDVGSVVGPPYAIMNIDPKMGPITGGSHLTIIGIDFINTPAVVVRFSTRKGHADVSGKYVSDTEIVCETPSFMKHGSGTVDVRLALKGDSFTTTFQRFTFFAVTNAQQCLAFGPGTLSGCLASKTVPTYFIVQARTSNGDVRTSGGDEFNVRVKDDEGNHIAHRITDNEDGTYMVSYAVAEPGDYSVSVEFMGTYGGQEGHVRGSPFHVTFKSGVPKTTNKLAGPLTMDKVKTDIKDLQRFTKSTHTGLRAKVPENSLDALLAVKEHLYTVQEREGEINLTIDRTRATIHWLAANGAAVGRNVEPALDSAVAMWEKIHKTIPVTRGHIAPLVKLHGASTRADLADYEENVRQYVAKVKKLAFWVYDTGVDNARRALDTAREQQAQERAVCDQKKHLASMFDFPELMEATLEMMETVDNQLQWMDELWDIVDTVISFIADSRDMLWSQVDADLLEETTKGLLKDVNSKINTDVKWCDAFKKLSRTIKNYLSTCPLILALHHPSMRDRHWKLLQEATSIQFTPPPEDPDLKLAGLLALNLHEFSNEVEEITDQALKEEKMETTLAKLEEVWQVVVWLSEPYKEDDDSVLLLKMSEEDFETLEADQLVVQGMMASRYLATFEEGVTYWQKALGNVADVVQILGEIQRTWSYLEPLFVGSDEVKRELPEDAARFAKIDMEVKTILKIAGKTGGVLDSCNRSGLLAKLEHLSEQLELCKKSLADFLDGKRRQFPRFYFVSEADLLDILSNGSTPAKILTHVTKVFLSTETLVLQETAGQARPSATHWKSGVGTEVVEFDAPVLLEGKVEIYLQTVLSSMQSTLNHALLKSHQRYPTQTRIEWLQDKADGATATDPAAMTILVAAMKYVAEVEEAFAAMARGERDALEEYNQAQVRQLGDLIKLTRTDLSKQDRKRVMVMITMDAHGRDIIRKLVREGVQSASAFQWQSQLKQYLEDGERARINICDASFIYGFEYLGNGARLVITPLTDRIYVTATQALNLMMGCAPAGPAGTGKTETTKDLAAALGKCCYVFNCSPEMDYRSMGNIFKGLAASGSWGCFDEFNRLVPEVLSVCSVQFKAVCDGIRQGRKTVVIEGDEVALDVTCGAYITMNPGYLGRSELPEGLKALFRPMTVMVPDLVLICENMMMAEGFEEAKTLATKFYGLYSLLAELLSKQSHYDWGLRAVKSVLVVAGGFKRAEPELREDELLMRALRDFNTPKIVRQDEVVFFGLLGDLFPGIDPPRKTDPHVETAVRRATQSRGLWPEDTFLLKVVQLEELLAIRHCVFVMGPPGAGKSQCWKTLADARKLLGQNMTVKDVNPKSISPEELYGYVTLATREWREGLLSTIMRDLGKVPNTDPKWIILDGDLDANWIESMNSVMDDNRMLTLANNERIPLKPHMRMIFEIRDLDYATPATVSRAGIIYISTDDGSQWRNLFASWLQQRPEPAAFKTALSALFDRYIPDVLLHIKKSFKSLVPVQDTSIVQQLLWNMEALLPREEQKREERNVKVASIIEKYHKAGDGDDVALTDGEVKALEKMFVFCSVWACGSALSEKDGENHRVMFSDYWKSTWKNVKFPSRETVFDYWLDPEAGKFELWKNSPYFFSIEYRSSTPMSQVTVPTPETCSVTFWMELCVLARHPVMLVGNAGCGKTQLVNGMLSGFDPAVRASTTLNFNFYTGSSALQSTLEGVLEKKAGINFGPPGTGQMVFFLDDLNLPEVDPYNTQSAIALLRQHIDYEHWFDRAKLTAKNILNCQYVAAMNPSAGSFLVNPRLQRHFATFAIGFPGPTSLLTIYQTFLDGHLRDFNEDIQGLSSNLINGALGLHAAVSSTFRKTAKNFHYEFNIRHLSNVFQGLLVAQSGQFKDPAKFVQLWVHESERVYGDRLVSYEDLAKYKTLAQAQAKKRFPQYNLAPFFAAENADPLVFCHFADNIQDKVYEQVTSMEALNGILVAALAEYNEMNATMDLVLFMDAMKHVCRISRIVLNPAGHALLVGVGGSGKQSLSRLAAFICGYTVSQITISATYSINDLKEDLKTMYGRAGLKDEGVMFLFTDSQITNERFLVYLNDLLASGNIPDLYSTEDKDAIVNSVVGKVKAAGLSQDRTSCWNFFLNQVRKNLHVVLCFSPVGDDFRNRALRFPALVSCTIIDWFQPWPKDALLSVGQKFLAEIEDLGEPEVRGAIEAFMPFSFQSVNDAAAKFFAAERRYCYTTPKSYLELLKLYQQLLAKKREEMATAIARLENGLLKLAETGEEVQRIEESLKGLLAEAEEKKEVSEKIAEEVAREREIVEKETAAANAEAKECQQIQAEVSVKQRDTEADLAKAEPAVEAAMAALDTLNKKDLGECKTMATPPKGVDDVFGAVVVLMAGVEASIITQKSGKVRAENRNWDAAKKALLSNVTVFIDNLKTFKAKVDAGMVPKVNWKEVRPYLAKEHFTVEVISTKNKAAAGLCAWVINIVMYRDILVTVEPKRKALREANEKLLAANTKLQASQKKVAELQAKLDKLTEEFNRANAEKQQAIDDVERGTMKLDLAQRLTRALADENVRWAEGVAKLKEEKGLLIGDVLLASAFISYIGPFTSHFRDGLISRDWVPFLANAPGGVAIPMSPTANPLSILTTEAEVAAWNSQGLPSDRVSVENGAVVMNSARWPLMIDPQLQGIAWVRQREGENLVIVRLGQPDILIKLGKAVEDGTSVLIENMGERIDAVLMPVVTRATIKKGSRRVVKMGDKELELNPRFRLFLHTKLSNPHYPPEIQAETTLVNFTVTESGLEDQLLSLVVRKERPDLAEQRSTLISEQNQNKIKIKELEDNILYKLATAGDDLTEDRELIEGLEAAKKTSMEVQVKMEVAQKTQEEIQVTSEKYRPVAGRGALLFFLMNAMDKVHTYYKYSLNAFVVIFLRGIDLVTTVEEDDTGMSPLKAKVMRFARAMIQKSKRFQWNQDLLRSFNTMGNGSAAVKSLTDEELVARCDVLMDSITTTVFNYLRRGLFDRDKLTIATQLCLKVMVRDGSLSSESVAQLVLGKGSTDPGSMGPLSDWMPESVWARVKALEELKKVHPNLETLGEDMQTDSDDWCAWFNGEQPEQDTMPGKWGEEATPIEALLILRATRPDRVTTALRAFVAENLGDKYVTEEPFDMTGTYRESSPSTPIFFVLFPGVDPTQWVEELGRKFEISSEHGNFLNISMGQGQEAPAEEALSHFAKAGGWIMLQNVHLMQSWLPSLERKLEVISETASPDFRCFISAEPPPMSHMKNIPESLLQSCIKVANEAPADLQSNLTRAWANFSQARIDACTKPTEMKSCLFALCFFHALVLGRRRFGQQGWSRAYSFNTGDLVICANVLESYLNAAPANVVPWDDLRYIFGEIMYGGHITDAWDRRTNNTYLQVLLTPTILEQGDLAPAVATEDAKGFPCPDAGSFDFDNYSDYIRTRLPHETPQLFGLHPNSEIGYLNTAADNLFSTILTLEGAGGGGGGGDAIGGTSVRSTLEDLLSRLPNTFGMIDIQVRVGVGTFWRWRFGFGFGFALQRFVCFGFVVFLFRFCLLVNPWVALCDV